MSKVKFKMTTDTTVYINGTDYVFVSDPSNEDLRSVRFYYVESGMSTKQVGCFDSGNELAWSLIDSWSAEKKEDIKTAATMIWSKEAKKRIALEAVAAKAAKDSKALADVGRYDLQVSKSGVNVFLNDYAYVYATNLFALDIRHAEFFMAEKNEPKYRVAWFEANSEKLEWKLIGWSKEKQQLIKKAVNLLLDTEFEKRKKVAALLAQKIIKEGITASVVVSRSGKNLKPNPKFVVAGQTVYWPFNKVPVDGKTIYYKCTVAAVTGGMCRIKCAKYNVDKWVDVRTLSTL